MKRALLLVLIVTLLGVYGVFSSPLQEDAPSGITPTPTLPPGGMSTPQPTATPIPRPTALPVYEEFVYLPLVMRGAKWQ